MDIPEVNMKPDKVTLVPESTQTTVESEDIKTIAPAGEDVTEDQGYIGRGNRKFFNSHFP